MADVSITFTTPLTEENLRQINAGLDGIAVARMQINLAKRAGLDVTKAEETVNDTEARLLQIKQVYFPGR